MENPLEQEFGQPIQISDEKAKQLMRELGIKTNAELLSEKARESFSKARTTTGKEREEHARAIVRLQQFVNLEEYKEILSSIPTTPEAIQELIRKGIAEDKEVHSLSSKIKRLFGGEK